MGAFSLLDGKNLPIEEDVRVPFFIRGPGIPAGQVKWKRCRGAWLPLLVVVMTWSGRRNVGGKGSDANGTEAISGGSRADGSGLGMA